MSLRFHSRSFLPCTVESRGKRLVPFGEPTAVPPIRVLRSDQVGAPIPSITWDARGSWIENGPLPHVRTDMPRALTYYESYAGSDANTGALTSAPFARPPGNCLALTIAHGASVEGLSERVIAADTKQTIASVSMLGRDTSWGLLGVDLPASSQRLQIVAEDRGQGWEQWLAIGEPHFCK